MTTAKLIAAHCSDHRSRDNSPQASKPGLISTDYYIPINSAQTLPAGSRNSQLARVFPGPFP